MKRLLIILLFSLVNMPIFAMEEYELAEIKPQQSQEDKNFDDTLLSAMLASDKDPKDTIAKLIEKGLKDPNKEETQTPLMVILSRHPQLFDVIRQRIEQ